MAALVQFKGLLMTPFNHDLRVSTTKLGIGSKKFPSINRDLSLGTDSGSKKESCFIPKATNVNIGFWDSRIENCKINIDADKIDRIGIIEKNNKEAPTMMPTERGPEKNNCKINLDADKIDRIGIIEKNDKEAPTMMATERGPEKNNKEALTMMPTERGPEKNNTEVPTMKPTERGPEKKWTRQNVMDIVKSVNYVVVLVLINFLVWKGGKANDLATSFNLSDGSKKLTQSID